MKKNDIVAMYGRKAKGDNAGYQPKIRGRIEKIDKDFVEIYWFYAKRTAQYPISEFEDLGKKEKDSKKGESNMIALNKENK